MTSYECHDRFISCLEGGDVVDELLHGVVAFVDVGRLEFVPVAVQDELWEDSMVFGTFLIRHPGMWLPW